MKNRCIAWACFCNGGSGGPSIYFQVSAYLVKQAGEHGQKVDVNSKDHLEIIENIFAHEDKDHDGVISHDEFSGPKHDEL